MENEEDKLNEGLFAPKNTKKIKLDADDLDSLSWEEKKIPLEKPVDEEEEVSLRKALDQDLNIKTPAD